jgi:hypothetical protein
VIELSPLLHALAPGHVALHAGQRLHRLQTATHIGEVVVMILVPQAPRLVLGLLGAEGAIDGLVKLRAVTAEFGVGHDAPVWQRARGLSAPQPRMVAAIP